MSGGGWAYASQAHDLLLIPVGTQTLETVAAEAMYQFILYGGASGIGRSGWAQEDGYDDRTAARAG
jgi:hypothetical protein